MKQHVVAAWAYSTGVATPAMHHDDCQVALFRFEDGSVAKVAALYAPRCAMAACYNARLYAIVEDRAPRTPLFDGANSTMATLCAAREGRGVPVPVFG